MAETPAPESAGAAAPDAVRPAKPVGPVTLQQIRDAWPEVLSSLQRTKRSAWMVAFTAQVRDFRDGDVLVLAFPSEHDVAGFRGGVPGQSVSELLRGAIVDVLGVRVKFVARVDGAGGTPVGGSPAAMPPAPAAPQEPAAPSKPSAGAPAATSGSAAAVESSAAAVRPTASEPRSAQASSSSAPNPSASTSTTASPAPAGPVDSWATVAIPRDPSESGGAESAVSGGRTATALAERPEPAPSSPAPSASAPSAERAVAPAAARVDLDVPPDDADAPPEDEEPPFDPGPEPEMIVEASPPPVATAPAPAARADRADRAPQRTGRPVSNTAGGDGIQRYGEAVVREVLGATFLEEIEAPARPGFGERG